MAHEIETLRDILNDYIDAEDPFYRDMIARLEQRENLMVTEIGPRFIYQNRMSKIIEEI